MNLVFKLSLNHYSVWVILVVSLLLVLVRNQLLILCNVNCQEISTLAVRGLKFNVSGLLQKLHSIVSGILESLSDELIVVRVSLVRLKRLLQAVSYCDLPRDIVIEDTSFVNISSIFYKIRGSDYPADLPTCAVHHFSCRENGDSSFIVVPNVGKEVILLSVEGKEVVDVV